MYSNQSVLSEVVIISCFNAQAVGNLAKHGLDVERKLFSA